MSTYTVKAGDSLESIAREHGFLRWQTLYRHPANAAFRARRPDPGQIAPGDQLFIPPRSDAQRRPPIRELAPFEPHREVIPFAYSRAGYIMAEGVGIHGSFRVQGYAIVTGAPGRWSMDVIVNMTTGASRLGSVQFSGSVQLLVDGRAAGPRRDLARPRGPTIRAADTFALDLEDPFRIPDRFHKIELSVLVIPVFATPEGRSVPIMRLSPERVLVLDHLPAASNAQRAHR